MRKPKTQTVFLGSVIVAAAAAAAYLAVFQGDGEAGNGRGKAAGPLPGRPAFDGQAAYRHLERLCALGPRPSGSAGMAAQQKMLADHFTKLGARVSLQPFDGRHPEDGSRVAMGNLVVQWHPDRAVRILLCAHYDTRPFPDADPDPRRRRGRFIGANDGASGVAVLCELGRHMPGLASRYGVDFALFDGEEFVFDGQRDEYFLGSTYFARRYADPQRPHPYRYAVLLDMVGDRDLTLYMEKYSLKYARPLVLDIWKTARRLGVRQFIQRARHKVRDDHLPLNRIAKIPTCDIIDFDFPRPGAPVSYWHTEADTPDKCSPESLAKVGYVVLQWLKRVE